MLPSLLDICVYRSLFTFNFPVQVHKSFPSLSCSTLLRIVSATFFSFFSSFCCPSPLYLTFAKNEVQRMVLMTRSWWELSLQAFSYSSYSLLPLRFSVDFLSFPLLFLIFCLSLLISLSSAHWRSTISTPYLPYDFFWNETLSSPFFFSLKGLYYRADLFFYEQQIHGVLREILMYFNTDGRKDESFDYNGWGGKIIQIYKLLQFTFFSL